MAEVGFVSLSIEDVDRMIVTRAIDLLQFSDSFVSIDYVFRNQVASVHYIHKNRLNPNEKNPSIEERSMI